MPALLTHIASSERVWGHRRCGKDKEEREEVEEELCEQSTTSWVSVSVARLSEVPCPPAGGVCHSTAPQSCLASAALPGGWRKAHHCWGDSFRSPTSCAKQPYYTSLTPSSFTGPPFISPSPLSSHSSAPHSFHLSLLTACLGLSFLLTHSTSPLLCLRITPSLSSPSFPFPPPLRSHSLFSSQLPPLL